MALIRSAGPQPCLVGHVILARDRYGRGEGVEGKLSVLSFIYANAVRDG